MRSTHLAMLTATHRAYLEHIQVEDDLMRLNVGSQANLERYRDAVRQIANANEAIATLNQQKGTFLGRRQDAIDKRHRLENAQREMEALMRRASRDQDEARFVERVVLTLNELREALRMAARNEVQRLLNERFKELVTEHNLVERIEIDETYTLNYFDAAGRPVGRASLSSGLKQLAATALLWAMKDAAGYDMPVVIDTPLGRIDRENQNNMLVNYYPRLSHQVVILPTNAEIDERKKRSIEHLIAAEYLIDNDAGDSATVRRDALVNI
jgi:DNA sulfur modification protein DndD